MPKALIIQRLPIYTSAIATIVVMPALMDPINLPKLFVLCLGAGLSFALFLPQIVALWQNSMRVVVIVSAVFASALLLVSIASPQGNFRTLIGVWGRNNGSLTYLALLIIFLSLATAPSNATSSFLIKVLTLLGIFGAFYGWLQNIGADPIDWLNPGSKIILTLGNSNFASALLALTAISTLSMVLHEKTHLKMRVVLLFSFFIQLYLTITSGSLQGSAVLLLGSAILIGLTLTFSFRLLARRMAIAWWGFLIVILFMAVSGLVGSGPLATFLQPNLRSLQDRYYHWVAAANMFLDNTLFGVGIDSFGDYYRKYRTIEGIALRETAMTGTNNAHNTIMQISGTGGIVLLSAYLALILFTAYRGIIALRINEDKILVSGVFSIWIAFQVQSLVSIDQIGLVVWGWATAGCLVALSHLKSLEKNSKSLRKVQKNRALALQNQKIKITLFLIGSIPSILLIPVIQNELSLRDQLISLVNSDSEETLRGNGTRVVQIALNSKQLDLRLQAINYLLAVELNEDALTLAKNNTQKFPASFESWNTTAEIYERLGKKTIAVTYRSKSVDLDPLNSEIKKRLAEDIAAN